MREAFVGTASSIWVLPKMPPKAHCENLNLTTLPKIKDFNVFRIVAPSTGPVDGADPHWFSPLDIAGRRRGILRKPCGSDS